MAMILNYIKIAYRNIVRQKVYSIINILGLAVGMACAILLLLFVRDELSYDKHNSKHERIYMVQSHFTFQGKDQYNLGSSFALAGAFKDEYPAIEESVRTFMSGRIYFFDQKRELIGEDSVCYADPSIFKVFDHEFIYGSPEGALDDTNSIVLSETLATKYFGEQNPVGKTISRNNGVDYIVKGVFKDLPRQSFRRYAALIPMMGLNGTLGINNLDSRESVAFFSNWGQSYTYILLKENTEIESITGDYERFRVKYIAEFAKQSDSDFEPIFQSLADIYLHYKATPESLPGILVRIYILSFSALFILIIACINYMNLTTARSAGRAREVGVRRVLGAYRGSLIRQFLSESIVITMAALLIAFVLIELFLPAFNNLVYKEISFGVLTEPTIFTGLLIMTLIVGLIAGSYPAFVLSSFLPVNVIRGDIQYGKGRGLLRKVLVIIQFVISIIVIMSAVVLQTHVNFLQSMDLGINKENILLITPPDPAAMDPMPTFKKEILGNTKISGVARSNRSFGTGSWNTGCMIEDSGGKIVNKVFGYLLVDYDFIDLMGMKVLEGRSFSREMGTDQRSAFLVNETLVKEMGWTASPIGKRVQWGPPFNIRDGKVIGVLKDFHFQSLGIRLEPMIIMMGDNKGIIPLNVVSIKIHPENSKRTVDFIKKKWHELNPMHPFEYSFLEDIIQIQYQDDDKILKIIKYSAFLSIFISCLGLFGLSSFIAEKRTKEIGIRKAHGASIWNILFRLSYDFIKLVLISSIIAGSIAYYGMISLSGISPYEPDTSPWIFIIAACIMVLLIALATVSYHAVKAALTDPVKALRYE